MPDVAENAVSPVSASRLQGESSLFPSIQALAYQYGVLIEVTNIWRFSPRMLYFVDDFDVADVAGGAAGSPHPSRKQTVHILGGLKERLVTKQGAGPVMPAVVAFESLDEAARDVVLRGALTHDGKDVSSLYGSGRTIPGGVWVTLDGGTSPVPVPPDGLQPSFTCQVLKPKDSLTPRDMFLISIQLNSRADNRMRVSFSQAMNVAAVARRTAIDMLQKEGRDPFPSVRGRKMTKANLLRFDESWLDPRVVPNILSQFASRRRDETKGATQDLWRCIAESMDVSRFQGALDGDKLLASALTVHRENRSRTLSRPALETTTQIISETLVGWSATEIGDVVRVSDLLTGKPVSRILLVALLEDGKQDTIRTCLHALSLRDLSLPPGKEGDLATALLICSVLEHSLVSHACGRAKVEAIVTWVSGIITQLSVRAKEAAAAYQAANAQSCIGVNSEHATSPETYQSDFADGAVAILVENDRAPSGRRKSSQKRKRKGAPRRAPPPKKQSRGKRTKRVVSDSSSSSHESSEEGDEGEKSQLPEKPMDDPPPGGANKSASNQPAAGAGKAADDDDVKSGSKNGDETEDEERNGADKNEAVHGNSATEGETGRAKEESVKKDEDDHGNSPEAKGECPMGETDRTNVAATVDDVRGKGEEEGGLEEGGKSDASRNHVGGPDEAEKDGRTMERDESYREASDLLSAFQALALPCEKPVEDGGCVHEAVLENLRGIDAVDGCIQGFRAKLAHVPTRAYLTMTGCGPGAGSLQERLESPALAELDGIPDIRRSVSTTRNVTAAIATFSSMIRCHLVRSRAALFDMTNAASSAEGDVLRQTFLHGLPTELRDDVVRGVDSAYTHGAGELRGNMGPQLPDHAKAVTAEFIGVAEEAARMLRDNSIKWDIPRRIHGAAQDISNASGPVKRLSRLVECPALGRLLSLSVCYIGDKLTVCGDWLKFHSTASPLTLSYREYQGCSSEHERDSLLKMVGRHAMGSFAPKFVTTVPMFEVCRTCTGVWKLSTTPVYFATKSQSSRSRVATSTAYLCGYVACLLNASNPVRVRKEENCPVPGNFYIKGYTKLVFDVPNDLVARGLQEKVPVSLWTSPSALLAGQSTLSGGKEAGGRRGRGGGPPSREYCPR